MMFKGLILIQKMTFSLNRDIPVSELSALYRVDPTRKTVTIPNFLALEDAECLHQHLNSRDNWKISVHPYQEGVYTFEQTSANREFIQKGIESANQARLRGEFSYVFYRADPHHNNCSCSLCEGIRFIQSKAVIDKINEITGENVSSAISVFGSKYEKECFLTTHTDTGRGKIAFVLNLTKDWNPSYGGCLQFLEWNFRTVRKVIHPTFNSLSIFNVEGQGVPHSVSYIPPDVTGKRFAITGWFQ